MEVNSVTIFRPLSCDIVLSVWALHLAIYNFTYFIVGSSCNTVHCVLQYEILVCIAEPGDAPSLHTVHNLMVQYPHVTVRVFQGEPTTLFVAIIVGGSNIVIVMFLSSTTHSIVGF